ncbi:MAG: transposase [Cyanobacteria bacterium J06638_20]
MLEDLLNNSNIKSDLQQAVGYDSVKRIKGRKRFALVDTLGLILRVQVMAANAGEHKGGKQVLQRAKPQMGKQLKRFHTNSLRTHYRLFFESRALRGFQKIIWFWFS